MMLEKIKKPNDVKKLDAGNLPLLADEIRRFLIEKISVTGGHLASNLGVVELTIALHRVLDFPEDKLIWDVGHQAYTHKLLTGRREGFDTLRMYGGLSGFPKRSESDCDAFDTGHSTTSLAAGLGYVQARDLQKQDYKVFSVIGDGSLTGGMAFEALNNAAELKTNYVMILNDNTMSISPNVGGVSRYLGDIRTTAAYTDLKMGVTNLLKQVPGVGEHMVATLRRTKSSIKQLVIPGMLFEDLGITYLGPVDGHNIRQMIRVFREAARMEGPVIVHVLTKKGYGYAPAELHPDRFHGTGPFEIGTGRPKKAKSKPDYTDVFASAIKKCGQEYPRVVAVTAAMQEGTGLKQFGRAYPERLFDVGIAEQHAVTFAAGLALGGLIPVVAIYSSFLQRAVDQILQDVCMQNLHVVFALDRSGLVGGDGETHHGCFDLSYLSMMPNMKILAPKNRWELYDMMAYAIEAEGPVAVRYPKGTAWDGLSGHRHEIHTGQAEVIRLGSGVAILAVGSMVQTAMEAAGYLEAGGVCPTVVNMRFIKPIDTDLLDSLLKSHTYFVTMEENVLCGGFGERAEDYLCRRSRQIRVDKIGIRDSFISQGTPAQLKRELGMDARSVSGQILSRLGCREEKAQ